MLQQTVAQWQKVFWLGTIKLVLSGIIYLIFSTSDVQPWNSHNDDSTGDESEMESLKKGAENDRHTESNSKTSDQDKNVEKIA